MNISYRNSNPIYQQIITQIKTMLFSESLVEGSKLPSVRELAAELAINPNTIQRAYRELEAEGLIVSIPGKGSFVAASHGLREFQVNALLEKMSDVIDELFTLGLSEDEIKSGFERVMNKLKGGDGSD